MNKVDRSRTHSPLAPHNFLDGRVQGLQHQLPTTPCQGEGLFPALWAEDLSDHNVTSSSDEGGFLDPGGFRRPRAVQKSSSDGHTRANNAYPPRMLRTQSESLNSPPSPTPSSKQAAPTHSQGTRPRSWSSFNAIGIGTIHEEAAFHEPLHIVPPPKSKPAPFAALQSSPSLKDLLQTDATADPCPAARSPRTSISAAAAAAAAAARQGAARSATTNVHEDLELRILNERLNLLNSQRELAAMKCQQFTQMLEASLAKKKGGPRPDCSSGVPASPGPMFLVDDDEQYWSSPNFYRGRFRAPHLPPPSAAPKLPSEGCRLPHDTYFLDNQRRRRRSQPPNRHSRSLARTESGQPVVRASAKMLLQQDAKNSDCLPEKLDEVDLLAASLLKAWH